MQRRTYNKEWGIWGSLLVTNNTNNIMIGVGPNHFLPWSLCCHQYNNTVMNTVIAQTTSGTTCFFLTENIFRNSFYVLASILIGT